VALGVIYLRFARQAWHLWHLCVGFLFLILYPVSSASSAASSSHAIYLPHTIFVTHHLSFRFTYNFVTHHLSHTTLSHTIFHTPSFTYNFVTHHLSPHHLCHTPSFLHLLLCLSFLPRPRYNIRSSLLEEVDL
jgi:hypothetical protein